jgi:tetratricopeptide (TPR) repeat protein
MYRSIDDFRGAIERDRAYGLAWSGLADALSILEFYHYPAPDGAPDPLDAARRAVALAPGSGPAHASLGIILSIRQDGSAALRELERAIALAPSYAEPHAWLGWLHVLRGSPDAGLVRAARAVELDPLAPAFRAYLAETHLARGNAALALAEAEWACGIQPEYGLAHFMTGLAHHHLARPAEAREALEIALPLVPAGGTPSHAEIHAALAVVEAAAGDMEAARQRLACVRETGHAFSLGLAHAALGETEAALDAFETVRDWRSFSTEHFRYFFPETLGPIREHARGRAIVRSLDRRWGRDGSPESRAGFTLSSGGP